jgi:5-methyltetrahydropteroyltriglutamate--homocysteine methyltransferase
MHNRKRPPFRAEHVGSLLRPKALLDARNKLKTEEIAADELRRLEDAAVREVVRRQEEAGLQVVTDGEFRRTSWHMDFLCQIAGVVSAGPQLRPFWNEHGAVRNEIDSPKVVGRIGLDRTIFGDHFSFLKSATHVTPKLSIPAPSLLHSLGDTAFYSDREALFRDLAQAYAEEIRRLEALGCNYIQIDDTTFAMLGDANYRNKIRASSGDPDKRHLEYIQLFNDAVANRSPDTVIGVHTCRGNHRSAWVAEGGYDKVAEAVFGGLNVDALFLEYDDQRSGGFEPLRFVPKGKTVVLGLITSKRGTLEGKDDIKRRIDQAAKFIDLDQICLSPQCGFASTSEGNLLTEEEEFAKLRLIVEIATDVWGHA